MAARFTSQTLIISRTLIIAVALLAAASSAKSQQVDPGARVSGVVLTADQAASPIARAVVRLTPVSSTIARSTLSDERGGFAFADVRAGQYTLSVSKPGYLVASYGAAQPGDTAVPVAVTNGRDLTDLNVALTRSASISGVVRDQRGNPMSGAPVTVLRWSFRSGSFDRGVRALRAVPGVKAATSDARGAYRLYDLPPGEYVVMILERQLTSGTAAVPVTTGEDVERARLILAGRSDVTAPAVAERGLAFAQTFHPGTPAVAQATTIRVAAGDDRIGIDISVKPERTLAVSGAISQAGGASAGGPPKVRVRPADRSIADYRPSSVDVKPDGTFIIPRLFPGTYQLDARGARLQEGSTHWARLVVTVADADVKGLSVTLQPTVSVSGRVRFEADAGAALPSVNDVSLELFEAGEVVFSEVPTGRAANDGTFVIAGVTPSRYRITTIVPQGWTLKSIRGQDDVDYADALITVPETGAMPPLEVTYTKQTQSLSGSLQDASGRPATTYLVVVFSPERAYWTPQTRRVAAARPATDGSFAFANLPAGSYLIAAVTSVDDQQWFNPDWLAQLASQGIKVTIPEGGKVVQDLRIAK